MTAEFDDHADEYRKLINKYAAASGESLEFYIAERVRLLRERCELAGAKPPTRILDFGCGTGDTETFLRRAFPTSPIIGVDVSVESLRVGESLGLADVAFRPIGPGELPVETGTCDLLYSNGTFHHIEHHEHARTLRDLRRTMRVGGHAFIFENNPFHPVMRWAMWRSPIDRNARTLRPSYLARKMREAGFRVRKPEFYAFFPAALGKLRPLEPSLARVPMGAQYFVWGTAE